MKEYLKRTWKNKVASLLWVVLGIVAAVVSDGDITASLIMWAFGVPLFFAKENYIC